MLEAFGLPCFFFCLRKLVHLTVMCCCVCAVVFVCFVLLLLFLCLACVVAPLLLTLALAPICCLDFGIWILHFKLVRRPCRLSFLFFSCDMSTILALRSLRRKACGATSPSKANGPDTELDSTAHRENIQARQQDFQMLYIVFSAKFLGPCK